MEYKKGTNRDQLVLFSEKLDDLLEKNSPVRFIDTFVEKLDLEKLKFNIPDLKTGHPPYDPGLILKIYIYSYLNRSKK